MTHIADMLAAGRTFSFEFFPPKTPDAEITLEMTLAELELLKPSFVSVTYGTGGSTRERTHDLVVSINRNTTMTAMAHLTCAAHTRDELSEIVTRYRTAGVENILALGGDPPAGLDLPPGELHHAVELVELVQEVGPFCVGVAAHPELHPNSPDRVTDRDFLAAKLERADFGITQFFFRCEDYFRMLDELAALGIDKPVLAGIIPVTNLGQVERFAKLAGADFPRDFAEKLEAVAHDPDEVRRIGVEKAIDLTRELLDGGAPGIQFYTLNFSKATRVILFYLFLGPR